MDRSYNAVTGRKSQIIRDAIGVDYSKYEKEGIAFDYEAMMNDTGYTLEDHIRIQREYNVGNTPVFELHNLTALASGCRSSAPHTSVEVSPSQPHCCCWAV